MITNINRLIIKKMAREAVQGNGSFIDGFNFLSDPKKVVKEAKVATRWVKNLLEAIRKAPDNPYTDKTDEEIAGIILSKIDEKEQDE